MSQGISAELAKQIEDRTLSAAGRALQDIINACSAVHHLDEACRLIWKDWGDGLISDGESTCLVGRSSAGVPRAPRPGHAIQIGRVNGRVVSRFVSRQRQRSPDRKASRDRRRRLGGSSALPDNLRHHYTECARGVCHRL